MGAEELWYFMPVISLKNTSKVGPLPVFRCVDGIEKNDC